MREMIDTFAVRFDAVDGRGRNLLSRTADEILFHYNASTPLAYATIGECIIRSAAVVEQTFGGITTRLWDDPFEWTLPEKLSTDALIAEYLDEVAVTRQAGLAYFQSDDELRRQLPAPDRLRTVFELLLTTVCSAEHYLGRASAIYQTLTGDKLPRV